MIRNDTSTLVLCCYMMIRQIVVFCIFQSFMYVKTSKVIYV